MWLQGGSILDSHQFDSVRQGSATISWSMELAPKDTSQTGAAKPDSRILRAQKSLYTPTNLRAFDKALAEVFGRSAIHVPAQTIENAPEIDESLNSEQIYTKAAIANDKVRRLGSGRAAGLTVKTDSGYKIYMAPDAHRNPLQTYVHELSNKLSVELTGSMHTFGDKVNPYRGDPDTGAAVERAMFGP